MFMKQDVPEKQVVFDRKLQIPEFVQTNLSSPRAGLTAFPAEFLIA